MSGLTFDEEAHALEQIVRNQLAIKELEEQNALLKQFFKERPETYRAGTTTQRGKFFIKVSTNGRIDQKLAEEYFKNDPRTMGRIRKYVVDPARARAVLTEAQLKAITKQYDNRLEVGLV